MSPKLSPLVSIHRPASTTQSGAPLLVATGHCVETARQRHIVGPQEADQFSGGVSVAFVNGIKDAFIFSREHSSPVGLCQLNSTIRAAAIDDNVLNLDVVSRLNLS